MEIRRVISEKADGIFQARRAIHRIPEKSFQEEKTSGFLARALEDLGVDVRTKVGRTGVVGNLVGKRPGPTVMIRADMDGLPIQEETGLPYSSEHPGMMHACGHDANMAMVLGAAMVLSSVREDLRGCVKFVFQPAEEIASGAVEMIREGVLENPKVDCALGAHLWPGIPEGTVGMRPGPLMAAMDRFDIEVIGLGGHGAMPHLCVDALDVGVQVVNALQRIVSRQMNPIDPAVVTVGSFQAGSAFNIIAERALLSGTTRTFRRDVWEGWEERIKGIVEGVCSSMGARCKVSYTRGCPPLVNDREVTERLSKIAAEVVGDSRVVEPDPTMTGEDMAWYLERVPGCYFFLGVGKEGSAPLHNSRFQFEEYVLLLGVEVFCRAVLDLTRSEP